jgi:hypothetical protein
MVWGALYLQHSLYAYPLFHALRPPIFCGARPFRSLLMIPKCATTSHHFQTANADALGRDPLRTTLFFRLLLPIFVLSSFRRSIVNNGCAGRSRHFELPRPIGDVFSVAILRSHMHYFVCTAHQNDRMLANMSARHCLSPFHPPCLEAYGAALLITPHFLRPFSVLNFMKGLVNDPL